MQYHYRALEEKQLLHADQLQSMFGNLSELLVVNQQLLDRLTERRDRSVVIAAIGDIWLQSVDKFLVYDSYCANYPTALLLYKVVKNREDIKRYLEVGVRFSVWIS